LVPGQVTWDNALTAFENEEYGAGAAYLAAMLGEQALTAYMAKAFSIYESEICSAGYSGPKSGTKLLNPPIKITEKGMQHVVKRHTVNNIAKFAGKSKFNQGENVTALIQTRNAANRWFSR